MPTIYDSSTPLVLEQGRYHSRPINIEVKVNTGQVEIQLRDLETDSWYTPSGTDYILDANGNYTMDRMNAPATRIVATSDAIFTAIGVGT